MIKVKVLKRHVERAKKIRNEYQVSQGTHCPIALAIKEKTHRKVFVHADCIDYNGKEYHLSDEEKNFVNNFDEGNDWLLKTPFVVTLEK